MIQITEEEYKRLLELHNRAENTPVIKFNTADRDFASLAWDDYRNYMDALGKKYGYDSSKNAINKNREVVPYET